jgi:hypothetical protein
VSDIPHAVFEALDQAEPMLLDKLQGHGINRIEYVVGFVRPYRIYVWLCTDTDAQRDALPEHDPFLEEVRSVINQAGMPQNDAHVEGTATQSQETVDRKYEGSWFYALR